MMWRAAIGQSLLIYEGLGSAICRKTGRPIFMELSKYSVFTPQVPSWPALGSVGRLLPDLVLVDASRDLVQARGALRTLPFQCSLPVLFWNKALLQGAGLDHGEAIRRRDGDD